MRVTANDVNRLLLRSIMPGRFWAVEEVASLVGVSVDIVRRAIRSARTRCGTPSRRGSAYNGAGIELIQEALGHASIQTTTVSAHLPTKNRNEELTRFLG